MSTVAGPRAAVLGPLRDWMRTQSTSAGARVYAHGIPQDPTFPCVGLTLVGLVPDGTVTEQSMIQADCWAAKGQAADAETLAAEVRNVLEQATPGTLLTGSTVHLMGARTEGLVAQHDPDDGTARYVVTATVATKVAA